jgi:phospholipid/cholesterol/gamma-HCH transport system substrate-binding protein
MIAYHKEATVGALVLLGVVSFVFGAMWLRGQSWGNPPELRVAYADIGNLKVGSPVQISGAVLGRVEALEFERKGRVIAVLTYDDEKVTPTTNAVATIRGVGLLGDMVIDLDPGTGTPLPSDAVIEGVMEPGFGEIGTDLAAKTATALTSFNRMLDTALIVDMRTALRSSERLMRYMSDTRIGPTAEINATMRQLQTVTARFDTTLAGIDAPALSARLDSTLRVTGDLSVRLGGMTSRMDSLLQRINSGQGTIGKMMSDSTLYVELHRTLSATRALIDSLANHPEKLGITVRVF